MVSPLPAGFIRSTQQVCHHCRRYTGIQGLSFDDNSEPSSTNYYNSDKVQRLIQGQGGQTSQTALAKEIAERKSEDLRILYSKK